MYLGTSKRNVTDEVTQFCAKTVIAFLHSAFPLFRELMVTHKLHVSMDCGQWLSRHFGAFGTGLPYSNKHFKQRKRYKTVIHSSAYTMLPTLALSSFDLARENRKHHYRRHYSGRADIFSHFLNISADLSTFSLTVSEPFGRYKCGERLLSPICINLLFLPVRRRRNRLTKCPRDDDMSV